MTNDEGISKPKSRITSRYCGRGWPANQGVENEHPWFSDRENCGEDQWYNASELCVEKSLPTTAPRLSPGGRFRAAKSPGPAVQFELAKTLHRRQTDAVAAAKPGRHFRNTASNVEQKTISSDIRFHTHRPMAATGHANQHRNSDAARSIFNVQRLKRRTGWPLFIGSPFD